MTREQAIEVLIDRYNSGVIRGWTDGEWRLATDTVIAALREPAHDWVRTTDRLPTAEDGVIGATGEPEVLAVTKYAHGYFPDMKMVSEIRKALGRKYYPYWMPLPKLPEVEG